MFSITFYIAYLKSDDWMLAAWQLPDDCLTITWWLPDVYLMSTWRLPDNCFMTSWWLSYDCLTNAWSLNDFLKHFNTNYTLWHLEKAIDWPEWLHSHSSFASDREIEKESRAQHSWVSQWGESLFTIEFSFQFLIRFQGVLSKCPFRRWLKLSNTRVTIQKITFSGLFHTETCY